MEVLQEFPSIKAWLSFSCKDEEHLNSGEKFSEVFRIIDDVDCDENGQH